MIRIHCSTCDEQIEVRAEYIANFGFRLTIPAGWALAMWPAPRQTVGCPHCIGVSTSAPEKIDALESFDDLKTVVPAPSPEADDAVDARQADDAVDARQAEEFRKRFIGKPYGSKR